MKSALEQSVKEKLKAVAKSRTVPFPQLWRTLILERFLARISYSPYKDRFVLKGGTLLAKYLPLGRETQDLDFFIHKISNNEKSLQATLKAICNIEVNDTFIFELEKIQIVKHHPLPYTGAEITLLAKFGATRTTIRLDLGFGDIVEPVEQSLDLTTTDKGPLFESQIALSCYPKEFIFAEKLETVIFRGETNTRMKDFHDLYSLISLGNLKGEMTERAVKMVFQHRNTSLGDLPISFDSQAYQQMDKAWGVYLRRLNKEKSPVILPPSIEELVDSINHWLKLKTLL